MVPTLYLTYTADPTTSTTNVATYVDDTAVLASDLNPLVISRNLQKHLDPNIEMVTLYRRIKYTTNLFTYFHHEEKQPYSPRVVD